MVRHTSRYVPRKWRNETFADVGARLPCFIEDARFIENARLRFCAGRSTVSHCAVLTPRIRLLSLFKRGSWGEISSNSSRTSGLNAQSLNGKLGAPTSAMYVLHLQLLAHKEYLSPSLHVGKSSAAVPSNRITWPSRSPPYWRR